ELRTSNSEHPISGPDRSAFNVRCSTFDVSTPPEPSFSERVRVMRRHLDLMIDVFGEEHGCRMFRKVAPWYSKRFGPVNVFNKKVVLISSRRQFHEILSEYLAW